MCLSMWRHWGNKGRNVLYFHLFFLFILFFNLKCYFISNPSLVNTLSITSDNHILCIFVAYYFLFLSILTIIVDLILLYTFWGCTCFLVNSYNFSLQIWTPIYYLIKLFIFLQHEFAFPQNVFSFHVLILHNSVISE